MHCSCRGLVPIAGLLALLGCQGGAEQAAPETAAATVYEEYYVPALFGPWAVRVADAADIAAGDTVLDVACGTGVVAREAAKRVGADGRVTGLDIDPAMLAVARRVAPAIEWVQGDAQELPYPDDDFDVVTCQFGLMFFPDKLASIREMQRVVRPGGRVVVAVWGELQANPGYAELVTLIERHMGADSADLLRAPFALGDAEELIVLFVRAGVSETRTTTSRGQARFPSLRSWVETEVRGWVGLSQEVDESELTALIRDAEDELAEYVTADGSVRLPVEAHLVSWTAR